MRESERESEREREREREREKGWRRIESVRWFSKGCDVDRTMLSRFNAFLWV